MALDSLTRQQRRCLEAVSRGLTTSEIARELGIAEGTVNAHVDAAVKKLGAPNRRHAAYILVRERLSEDGSASADASEKIPRENLRLPDPPLSDATRDQGRVEEERSPYLFQPLGQTDVEEPRIGSLTLISRIAFITLAIAIILLALRPLVDAASELARSIDPPTAR